MAGVITHMVIAREIQRRLPEGTIQDMGLFYLGNLAPDAIHARKGYVRPLKKHTHFRDDIADKDFALTENLKLFHDRVSAFILKNRHRSDGLLDLYRGYVTHILADELFILRLRKEFSSLMDKMGIRENDPLYFQYIVADMNRNDLLLIKRYEGSDEIRQMMEQVPIHPIKDYISHQEMELSREWLLHQHYHTEHELLEPVYISYDSMTDYIREAAENITKRLSDGGSLPRMF